MRWQASLWLERLRKFSRIAFFLRSAALLRLMRANRRFACRLKRALPVWASPTQESHPLWKNAREKPACGFFIYSRPLFLIRGTGPRLRRGAARGGDILFLRLGKIFSFLRERGTEVEIISFDPYFTGCFSFRAAEFPSISHEGT